MINSLSTAKAPGPDGLPVDFYLAHASMLAPQMAAVFTHCLEQGSLPPSMAHAHVILIPKTSKDPKSCASYRPIGLLNNDLKILTKLLTARLNPLLPSLIDSDQTGFMTNKSTDINLRRLSCLARRLVNNLGTRVVASLDIEKAFDSIEWPSAEWDPPGVYPMVADYIPFALCCHSSGGSSFFRF